jgi:hypothetical protein
MTCASEEHCQRLGVLGESDDRHVIGGAVHASVRTGDQTHVPEDVRGRFEEDTTEAEPLAIGREEDDVVLGG